jgi:hypothetical protein
MYTAFVGLTQSIRSSVEIGHVRLQVAAMGR